jgi:predicted dehydrogenase
VEQIHRGLLGEVHYIRAQWHRGNMPYPKNDSWQQPMPKEIKPDDKWAKQLDADLKSWEAQLRNATSTRDIELWSRRVAQKKAQIADVVLKDTAADYGYLLKQYTNASGKVIYTRPPAEELIRWRLWDRTGGGLMAELGSHQLDAAGIFITAAHQYEQIKEGKADKVEKQHPLSVVASANRPLFPVDRDVEDHVFCVIEFPAPGYDPDDKYGSLKKIGVQYASINGNGFGGYGETVFGTEGTLILEREQDVMLFAGSDTSSKIEVSQGAGPTLDTQESAMQQAAVGQAATQEVSRGYTEEEEHWAWCIREDPDNKDPNIQPKCHPKVAMADAVIALTTNIAARKDLRVEFKPEWFDPDHEATPEDDLGTVE